MPPALLGMAWMVGCTVAAVSTHVIVRRNVGHLDPFQIVFLYHFFSLPALLPMLLRNPSLLRTRRHGLLVLRGAAHLASMTMFYIGLPLVPLAVAGALGFLAPLFAVALGAVLLREGFSARRLVALVFGIAGMLVIVRPDPGAINEGALWLIGAAAIWGAVLVLLKVLGRTESSGTLTVWMALTMAPLALIPAIPVWQTPALADMAWLALAGTLGIVSHFCLSQALRTGAINVVMPVDFLRLLWSALFGFAFFAEIPDLWTVIGGTMIFSATTWLALRERAAARAAAAAAKARAESP